MKTTISQSFSTFLQQAPIESRAWTEMVDKLAASSKLESKTRALCYLSALAATRMVTGLEFHARQARALGATRDEVISAVLVGLPAVGHAVVEALPPALAAFD